jgi:hypothetical protein
MFRINSRPASTVRAGIAAGAAIRRARSFHTCFSLYSTSHTYIMTTPTTTTTTSTATSHDSEPPHTTTSTTTTSTTSTATLDVDVPATLEPSVRLWTMEDDVPPLRMGATRVPERLIGRRKSARSTSPRRIMSSSSTTATSIIDDSSVSSMDMDNDIFTDRMGMEDLNSSVCSREQLYSALPPVNERLSEDTLEDVHAFSDISRSSRGNSVAALSEVGSLYLDTLEEEGEDDNDGGVMISNMENLTILEECEKEEFEASGQDNFQAV